MHAPAAEPTLSADPPRYRRWLQMLAWLLVAATFALIAIGGTVTSLDAGLAVPGGWMTFDDFTPFAPLETWWDDGQTRWEHSHRLKGYIVGMLTLAVAAGLWHAGRSRAWITLAALLVVMVIAQGVMGAMRVDLAQTESRGPGVAAVGTDNPLSTALRILHGVTGQLFLCLTVIAAVAVSRPWLTMRRVGHTPDATGRRMVRLAFWLWVVFLIQLTLGAAVRHTNAALAIPDFPLHFGTLIPPLTQASLDAALARAGIAADIGIGQMYLHLAHRLFAWLVCAKALFVIWRVFQQMDWPDPVFAPSITIVSLLVVQVVLGITVVLSGEAAAVATTHQVVGAVLFASAAWLVMRVRLVAGMQAQPAATANPQPPPPQTPTPTPPASQAPAVAPGGTA